MVVNKKRMLEEFVEMAKIASPTRRERELADFLKSRLEAIGLEVTEDDAGDKIGGNCGNLLAYLKGTVPKAPILMLNAHMDCVQPCEGVVPQVSDGVIKSSGDTVLGADDKSGVAAIMEALRVIREEGINHGDIQVVFTVAEEGGLNGSLNLERTLLKADFGYVLDSGGSPGEIITSAPGQNSITAVIKGKAAHAGVAPEEGINAIVVASKAIAKMRYGRIDAETTANIGIIKGGTATNIVPDAVEVFCEARSRNMAKLAEQTAHMKETFMRVAIANGAVAEVSVEKAYDAYNHEDNGQLIRAAVKAVESVGLLPELRPTGGGSDANIFNSLGLPVVVLGTGMKKVHTTEEYIKEEDLYRTAELVISIVKTVAGVSS